MVTPPQCDITSLHHQPACALPWSAHISQVFPFHCSPAVQGDGKACSAQCPAMVRSRCSEKETRPWTWHRNRRSGRCEMKINGDYCNGCGPGWRQCCAKGALNISRDAAERGIELEVGNENEVMNTTRAHRNSRTDACIFPAEGGIYRPRSLDTQSFHGRGKEQDRFGLGKPVTPADVRSHCLIKSFKDRALLSISPAPNSIVLIRLQQARAAALTIPKFHPSPRNSR